MTEHSAAPKRAKKPNILLRLLALLVTCALVLGALVLVVYRDRFNLDALRRWLSYRSMETTQTGQAAPFIHAGGSKMSLAYLDGGVVTASTAGAHYYSLSGEKYAEDIVSMDSPVLTASRSTGVAYDAGGRSLFLFRDGEERFELELEGGADLLSARPNDDGWLAVTAQRSGYKGAVTVYDDKYEPKISISLSSTFVVDAALSPDGRTVAVVTMGQEGGSFFSRLLFYPVNKTEPSAQVDLGDMVVLDLDYEDDLVWVLGEDRLTIAAPNGGRQQTFSFAGSYLKGFDLGGDGFALLLTGRYRAGSATQALLVDRTGTAAYSLDLTSPVLDLDAAGRYCALLSGSQLTIFNERMETYASLADTQGARHVSMAPDGSALLANEQQAWLYIPN